jgi:hypothetical protein
MLCLEIKTIKKLTYQSYNKSSACQSPISVRLIQAYPTYHPYLAIRAGNGVSSYKILIGGIQVGYSGCIMKKHSAWFKMSKICRAGPAWL